MLSLRIRSVKLAHLIPYAYCYIYVYQLFSLSYWNCSNNSKATQGSSNCLYQYQPVIETLLLTCSSFNKSNNSCCVLISSFLEISISGIVLLSGQLSRFNNWVLLQSLLLKVMTSPEDGPTGKTTESRHQLPDVLPDPNSNPAGTSSAPSCRGWSETLLQ